VKEFGGLAEEKNGRCPFLARELLHLPDKPAGVVEEWHAAAI
jgi:hypothetical protein